MKSIKPPFIRPEFSPMSIARMLWKRKIAILLIWSLVTAAAFGIVSTLPSIYSAEALILVDSQKIPERYVSSTVSIDVQDRLATITQQILSGTQLEKLLDEFNLYSNERKLRFREEKIMMLRRSLAVRLEKGWSGNHPGAFRVSFEGPDQVQVAKVANRVAQLFIQENVKTREGQAAGTSEFIEAQLQEAKQRLDDLEATVSRYKVMHNGELPQQENTLIGTLGRLQVQLEANRDAMNRGEQSIVLLDNTLSMAEATAAAYAQSIVQTQAASRAQAQAQMMTAALNAKVSDYQKPAAPIRDSAEALRSQIAELKTKYSDEHPDIRRLEVKLEKLEKEEAVERVALERAAQEAAQQRALAEKKPAQAAVKTQVAVPAIPQGLDVEALKIRERITSVKAQISFAKAELQKRKADQEIILRDIAAYQGRVDKLPIREQEMAKVNRDYEISKGNYKSLLEKKLAADMASDMERRQKSERFTLADEARIPYLPSRPNRPMLEGGGCLFGLALGVLLALALELRKDTILGEWELPAGVTVLGTLPSINISVKSSHERFWKRKRKQVIAAATTALPAIIAIAAGSLSFPGRV